MQLRYAHFMRPYLTFFVFIFLVSGCLFSSREKRIPESKLDSQLSGSRIPVSSPEAGPGEPQKGFDQEPAGAQNR